MACITTSYTALYAYYAFSDDPYERDTIHDFWMWITIPISVTAMGISFCLKPRREDLPYKVFIYIQFIVYAVMSQLFSINFGPWKQDGAVTTRKEFVASCLQLCLLWPLLFALGMKVRSRIAKLPDEDLSKFLTNDVIMIGMFVGLGQITFLMLGAIQCNGNADDWRDCNRTLISQTGLGGMVTIYTIFKLVSGVVPKRILEKHTISMKKFLSMDLNAGEALQAVGLLVAALCALYPLGNYGAEGNFRSDAEKNAAITVPGIGVVCLLLIMTWKAVVMWREMRREEKVPLQASQGVPPSNNVILVEGSSFWHYVAASMGILELATYVIMWWLTKVVQASVRSEWRKDLNLSVEKIARMRDFSIQRGVQGVLTLVTGVCGIFLFSMMSADNTDTTTLGAVGYTGLASIIAVFISETYSSLKAQERRFRESESGQIEEERMTLSEEPVEEVSWVFVGVSFLFALTFTVLCFFYAVALEVKYWSIACLILPIAALSWVMALFYKPKRTDAGYLRFLYFHFLTFVVVGLGLKWWQRLQGGLMTITAIASLNLLSILGVEGDENSMVGMVGATGLLSIGFALLINATMLIRTKKELGNLAATTHENDFQKRRTISAAVNDVEDDALVMTVL
ncbi:hypothetical protein TrCOL_g1227 [Triparma columacea]|nr:hypothetical protein TrCOL_g1227 [Triparma columacea]